MILLRKSEEDPSTHYCRGNYYDNETGTCNSITSCTNGTYASTTATAISDNVCTSIQCTSPSTTGYTITGANTFADTFDITATCAPGYENPANVVATAQPCSVNHDEYILSGCVKCSDDSYKTADGNGYCILRRTYVILIIV